MKKYINVIVKFDTNGDMTPIQIVDENGTKFDIDRVVESRKACSLKSGGTGLRYTIKIKNKLYFLFCEGQNVRNQHSFSRWFVEEC